MIPPKDAERAHCEAVAYDIVDPVHDDANIGKWTSRIADLIQRERAAARDAALDEAAAVAAKRADAKHSVHFIRSKGGNCDACTEAGVVATLIRTLKGKVTHPMTSLERAREAWESLCVGLRADEEDRDGLYGDYATYRYPLREWGWKLADVHAYVASRGVTLARARAFVRRHATDDHPLLAEVDAASDAGKALAERVRLLEAVVEASGRCVSAWSRLGEGGFTEQHEAKVAEDEMRAALCRLDAHTAGEQGGTR